MKLSKITLAIAAIAALFAVTAAVPACAQAVTQQPQFAAPRAVLDLGNGPTEIKMLTGSMGIFTSQSSGVGSGTTTSITLTASAAANPPCVGCAISGGTLGPTSVVTAFNGTTGITVNTSQTIAASTPLSWGMACPALGANGNPPLGSPSVLVQAGVNGDLPLYTLSRICAAGLTGPGGQFVSFAIGAH